MDATEVNKAKWDEVYTWAFAGYRLRKLRFLIS
jgi:hypothetical protein